MTCTCEWMWRFPSLADPTSTSEPYWLLHHRDPGCATHGDGTPWWALVELIAMRHGYVLTAEPWTCVTLTPEAS